MGRIRQGERDRFAESRDLITMIAAMATAITHLAYVARFFILRPKASGAYTVLPLAWPWSAG